MWFGGSLVVVWGCLVAVCGVLGCFNAQDLDVDFILYLYTLYVVKEGRTLRCCTNCFWVNYTVIIQVTILCVLPLNKQLHALSSALYQKFATFAILLSFCFFCEV